MADTKKGYLRTATLADAEELLNIYAPYVEKTTISFEWVVPTKGDFHARIENVQREYPYIVYEQDGQLLGYAYAHRPFERYSYRFCAELSVYVRWDARGRGIGKRLYLALIALCQEMRLQTLYGVVTNPNEPSFHLHESLGFRRAAYFSHCGHKMGKWIDVVWYERLIGSDLMPPPEMIPFPQLENTKIEKILQKYS